MRSSCINWPKEDSLISIRQSQIDLCEGNKCAAALINFFERYHKIKIQEDGSKLCIQNYTEKQLKVGIVGLYGEKTIRLALRYLEERKIIKICRNPSSRLKSDQTHHFQFYPEIINNYLSLCYTVKKPDASGQSARSVIEDTLRQKEPETLSGIDTVKVPDRRGKSAGSISEDTSEIEVDNSELKRSSPKKQPDLAHHHLIIEKFHEIIPEAPRVLKWSKKRQGLLNARIKEFPVLKNIEWWAQLFRAVRDSDFLMGQVSNFMITLPWLIMPENFLKVIEKKYAQNEGRKEVENEGNELDDKVSKILKKHRHILKPDGRLNHNSARYYFIKRWEAFCLKFPWEAKTPKMGRESLMDSKRWWIDENDEYVPIEPPVDYRAMEAEGLKKMEIENRAQEKKWAEKQKEALSRFCDVENRDIKTLALEEFGNK